jgi:lysozyme
MLPGIDVSHYQGVIDWAKVQAAGIQFAYLKATEGASFVDPQLAANVKGAAAVGIPIGQYHVFVANGDDAQLKNWRDVSDHFPSQLPAWLDVEPGSVTEETIPILASFLAGAFELTDCIYASPATIQGYLTGPLFQDHPLAVAHYGVPAPNFAPWPSWMFWQHSSQGSVDGIEGPVDLDWFNGDSLPLKVT